MTTYSREFQDVFVLWVIAKEGGKYLEIGAHDPVQDSNTYLLESEYNWEGISIEIDYSFSSAFVAQRKNIHVNADATTINYLELLQKHNYPKDLDYLQIDCDPAVTSFKALKQIPFDDYRFGVITFEHDFYNYKKNDINYYVKQQSRAFLKEKGYLLVGSNICHQTKDIVFEDWWLHPDLIDPSIISLFDPNDYSHKEAGEFVSNFIDKLTKTQHPNFNK